MPYLCTVALDKLRCFFGKNIMKIIMFESRDKMVRSMTGYGRGAAENDGRQLSVEIKAVNHRYFECSVRLPREYNFAEDKIKSLVKQYAERGKIDVFLTLGGASSVLGEASVNHAFAKSYIEALKELAETYGIKDDISVMTVAQKCRRFFRYQVRSLMKMPSGSLSKRQQSKR